MKTIAREFKQWWQIYNLIIINVNSQLFVNYIITPSFRTNDHDNVVGLRRGIAKVTWSSRIINLV